MAVLCQRADEPQVFQFNLDTYGWLDLQSLALLVCVCDAALARHRVPLKDTLIGESAVSNAAQAAFTAIGFAWEAVAKFCLYSFGRATGTYQLGTAVASVMTVAITALMNHTAAVAERVYWMRDKCVLLWKKTKTDILPRCKLAEFNPDTMRDIVLPHEPELNAICHRHAAQIARDHPDVAAFFAQAARVEPGELPTPEQLILAVSVITARHPAAVKDYAPGAIVNGVLPAFHSQFERLRFFFQKTDLPFAAVTPPENSWRDITGQWTLPPALLRHRDSTRSLQAAPNAASLVRTIPETPKKILP